MRIPIIILILCILWQFNYAQPIKVLRVNPDNSYGGTAAQIFDSVIYIPLETTKESMFGSISNLQVSEHFYVFYDFSTKGIFIFDKGGKFVNKITTAPNLPKDQAWSLNAFVLNPYDECIYVPYFNTVHRRPKNMVIIQVAVFQSDGQVSRLIKLDKDLAKGINYSSFVFLDSNTTLISRETRDSGSHHYFVILKDFKEVVKNLAPIVHSDPFIDYAKNYHVFSQTKDYSVWARNLDYDVAIMERTGLLKYRFVFPASLTMDSAVYKDSALMKDGLRLEDYINKHKQWITNIIDLYKSGSLLTFTLAKGNTVIANNIYLTNLTSGNLYSFGKITPDSSNGYLPLVSLNIAAADKDYIYSWLPSYTLFEVHSLNESRHPVYSTVMQRYFATENRKSNPVIVQLKPKKNL